MPAWRNAPGMAANLPSRTESPCYSSSEIGLNRTDLLRAEAPAVLDNRAVGGELDSLKGEKAARASLQIPNWSI